MPGAAGGFKNKFGVCEPFFQKHRLIGMPAKDPKAYAKQWRAKPSSRTKEKQALYYRRNPGIYLVNAARSRARKTGIPFDIHWRDLAFPTHCPVLGIPLEHGTKPFHQNSPSLDRIVGEKGYVKGNVIVVSFRANRIKGDSTPEELRQVAEFYTKLEQERDQSDPSPTP